jgi:AraC-like DNA-binding protein
MQSLGKAIQHIESNLTSEISVEDVSKVVYASHSNFQRIFNLVTGMTIGDYIRNRRLSLAGEDLTHPKNKIIDVAMKYRYDTQESFSKAFTRFHGVTPSGVRKQPKLLKNFRPLSIHLIIQGGFDMSRKLIDHLPIHQLQYPWEGQNYVFNGCMKFLMECVGEDERYDYWFFSAVSGDSFVQVYAASREKSHAAFSDAKFDYALIKRVFDAIGYDFTYMGAEEWRRDKEKCKAKIMEYINRGIPVIGKGFHWTLDNGDVLPTDEISCVVGYEDDGERFYRLPEEATDLIPFTLDDGLPYTFVFIEGKKEAPPIAAAYRKALLDAPGLIRTPPGPSGDVFFGNDAFERWARALESNFYEGIDFEAHNGINVWRHYGTYITILSTNIFHKKDTTDRALQMNPDLADLVEPLAQEQKALEALEKRLTEAGGYFDANYEIDGKALRDAGKRGEIARILRLFTEVYARICDIIERNA